MSYLILYVWRTFTFSKVKTNTHFLQKKSILTNLFNTVEIWIDLSECDPFPFSKLYNYTRVR